MKKNSINLIIGLMALALLGVTGMQFYYLKQSYQLKSQLFDQAVNEALTNVVNKLERQEAYNFLNRDLKEHSEFKRPTATQASEIRDTRKKSPTNRLHRPRRNAQYAKLLRLEQHRSDSLFNVWDSVVRSSYPYVYAVNETPADIQQMKVQIDIQEFEDGFGNVLQQTRSRIVPERDVFSGRTSRITTRHERTDSIKKYLVIDSRGNYQIIERKKPVVRTLSRQSWKELEKREPIAKKAARKIIDSVQIEEKKDVFQDIATELQQANIPLSKRIDPRNLDSLLRTELLNRGIDIKYDYLVSSAKGNSVIFTKAADKTEFLPEDTYKTVLFPKDIFRDAGILSVTFPERNSILLSNLTAMMASSGALLLILIVCFGFTLHLILRQKKISEIKTDFINNMTHEFKTPVSTIMIASEALRDPDVSGDKARINRLAGIIYDENVRLGNHIERVLNIAKLDKGNLKLEHKHVDVNDIIAAVTDSMQLQLQKKDAKVTLELNADPSIVNGDELHLSNVIFNLIDNANKYSKDIPEISISTYNTGKNLVIRITDKGIGMSKDQLSKIFGQFYRIPTGNLHDVKGFGLGLSYVNDIIKRLSGTIRVKSEKDKGSEFEITFPAV
jgi:two-component system, OmpR family, phosphate regulon sensor histidine kinase PhoR